MIFCLLASPGKNAYTDWNASGPCCKRVGVPLAAHETVISMSRNRFVSTAYQIKNFEDTKMTQIVQKGPKRLKNETSCTLFFYSRNCLIIDRE